MSNMGYSFFGPIPPSTWSRDYHEYNGLFLDIRRISRTHFDEYSESARGEPLAVAEQKLKVQSIIDAAHQCRSERLNEEGWIRAIEPGVVSRLGTEVVWSVCRSLDKMFGIARSDMNGSRRCRNHLWKAEFQAVPFDTEEAERLRKRRARRKPCACDLTARAEIDRYLPSLLYLS